MKNMKSIAKQASAFLLLGMAVCSCTYVLQQQDHASYVNPFIGTGGHGHTYPGAVVPNGMIQPSPDTRIYQWMLVPAIIMLTPRSTVSHIPISMAPAVVTMVTYC